MRTTIEIEARRAALLAGTDTDTLLASALLLDMVVSPTEEQRMVRAWTTGEVERRHPEVSPALDAWANDLETSLTYTEALVAALA
jgi:hypothetical protein